MKTIIAGSREGANYADVKAAVANCGWVITEVFSGGARGVDSLGELWAREFGIPLRRFPPNWNALGKTAGIIRNSEMAAEAQALVAIWDGRSPGTGDMILKAYRHGLRVHVHRFSNQ